MKFTTETGSVYEFDKDKSIIRRLSGIDNPTPRVGADEVFKACEIEIIQVGKSVVIHWENSVEPLIKDSMTLGRMTVTSCVVNIEE